MNNKWDSVDITKFTNSGHFDFTSNTLSEAKKVPAIVEKCGPELAAMEAAVTEEDEALIHALKSSYTKELWDNDKLRDRRYTNVSELTRAYTKWPEEMAQKQAADRVLGVLDLYNLKTQAQVNKETGVMTNLLQELQGQLAADIETLGLTAIVAEMAAANAEVNRIYNDRLWADSVKVAGRVAKARAEVDRCYMALREKVNALVIVFGAEAYSGFIGYMNERIAKAKRWQLAPKKKGTAEGSEEEEEEVTEEETTEEETTEEDTNTPTLVTALFKFHSGQEEEVKAEAGAALTAPANTEGYSWRPTVPAVMPAENTTYTEVSSGSIPIPPGPGGDDDDL